MSLGSKSARLAVLVSAAAVSPALSAGQESDARPATILVTGPTALDVSVAVHDAVSRLRDDRCQLVLDDFTDRDGRSLREGLGGSSPDAYLLRLVVPQLGGDVTGQPCLPRADVAQPRRRVPPEPERNRETGDWQHHRPSDGGHRTRASGARRRAKRKRGRAPAPLTSAESCRAARASAGRRSGRAAASRFRGAATLRSSGAPRRYRSSDRW